MDMFKVLVFTGLPIRKYIILSLNSILLKWSVFGIKVIMILGYILIRFRYFCSSYFWPTQYSVLGVYSFQNLQDSEFPALSAMEKIVFSICVFLVCVIFGSFDLLDLHFRNTKCLSRWNRLLEDIRTNRSSASREVSDVTTSFCNGLIQYSLHICVLFKYQISEFKIGSNSSLMIKLHLAISRPIIKNLFYSSFLVIYIPLVSFMYVYIRLLIR